MLPPFIIEQIRKREEDERRKSESHRPVLQLPLHDGRPAPQKPEASDPSEADRGVVIIDLRG